MPKDTSVIKSRYMGFMLINSACMKITKLLHLVSIFAVGLNGDFRGSNSAHIIKDE